MTELKYNIKYPEYNFNYHIKKDLYYNRTIPLLSKCKKNSFENKCTQTEKTFQNRTFSNDSDSSSCSLGSPLSRTHSISNYHNNKKKEITIEKVKSIFKESVLLEDVEEEKEFIKVNKKIMSVKEIEKYIFINDDDKIGVLSDSLFLILKEQQEPKLFKYKDSNPINFSKDFPELVKDMETYTKANLQTFQYMLLNKETLKDPEIRDN